MPESKTSPKKILIKGGKPRKFPPKPDYGGKPPGPRNIRPKSK